MLPRCFPSEEAVVKKGGIPGVALAPSVHQTNVHLLPYTDFHSGWNIKRGRVSAT